MAADHGAAPLEYGADERLAVDGVRDGAAHAQVGQRCAPVVQCQQSLAAGGAQQQLVAAVGHQATHRVGGEVQEQVHLLAVQGRCLCLGRVEEAERRAAHVQGFGVAVGAGRRQRDAMAALPLLHAVRAGAHGRGGGGAGTRRAEDHGRVLAQAEGQVRVGMVQPQHHGVRVGRGDVRDVVEQRRARLVGRAGRACALEAEAHRCGVKGRAVVKAHALAQLQRAGALARIHLPALRQQGRHAAVLLDARQALQHVVVHHLAHGGRSGHGRIQAVGLQRQVDDHPALVGALRGPGPRGGSGQGQGVRQVGAARKRPGKCGMAHGGARNCDKMKLHRSQNCISFPAQGRPAPYACARRSNPFARPPLGVVAPGRAGAGAAAVHGLGRAQCVPAARAALPPPDRGRLARHQPVAGAQRGRLAPPAHCRCRRPDR